jgi:hypothetical protein
VIPSKTDFVFSTRLRHDDIAFWRDEVEPIIEQEFDGNRTAFIMDAVKRRVATKPATTKRRGK